MFIHIIQLMLYDVFVKDVIQGYRHLIISHNDYDLGGLGGM